MVVLGAPQTRFRHVYGQAAKREHCYDNLKITGSPHESMFVTVNKRYLAFVLEMAGGGGFALLDLARTGRYDGNIPKVTGHSGAILDIKWSPFHDNVIASASDDSTVKIWSLPRSQSGGLRVASAPAVTLRSHLRRASHLSWHPAAENILVSGGGDGSCYVWDVNTGQAAFELAPHGEAITGVEWTNNGAGVVTTCKDKHCRVLDARSGKAVLNWQCHGGTKTSKAVTLRDERSIITTGFTSYTNRQLALWDTRSLTAPVQAEDLGSASAPLFPLYDKDLNMLYIAAKGEGNIRYYELTNDRLVYLSQYQSNNPQRALGIAPKAALDLEKNEVYRFYKFHSNRPLCEPVAMIAPRKAAGFQQDLYPPTADSRPALSAAEWLSGRNAASVTTILTPNKSPAQPLLSPISTKSEEMFSEATEPEEIVQFRDINELTRAFEQKPSDDGVDSTPLQRPTKQKQLEDRSAFFAPREEVSRPANRVSDKENALKSDVDRQSAAPKQPTSRSFDTQADKRRSVQPPVDRQPQQQQRQQQQQQQQQQRPVHPFQPPPPPQQQQQRVVEVPKDRTSQKSLRTDSRQSREKPRVAVPAQDAARRTNDSAGKTERAQKDARSSTGTGDEWSADDLANLELDLDSDELENPSAGRSTSDRSPNPVQGFRPIVPIARDSLTGGRVDTRFSTAAPLEQHSPQDQAVGHRAVGHQSAPVMPAAAHRPVQRSTSKPSPLEYPTTHIEVPRDARVLKAERDHVPQVSTAQEQRPRDSQTHASARVEVNDYALSHEKREIQHTKSSQHLATDQPLPAPTHRRQAGHSLDRATAGQRERSGDRTRQRQSMVLERVHERTLEQVRDDDVGRRGRSRQEELAWDQRSRDQPQQKRHHAEEQRASRSGHPARESVTLDRTRSGRSSEVVRQSTTGSREWPDQKERPQKMDGTRSLRRHTAEVRSDHLRRATAENTSEPLSRVSEGTTVSAYVGATPAGTPGHTPAQTPRLRHKQDDDLRGSTIASRSSREIQHVDGDHVQLEAWRPRQPNAMSRSQRPISSGETVSAVSNMTKTTGHQHRNSAKLDGSDERIKSSRSNILDHLQEQLSVSSRNLALPQPVEAAQARHQSGPQQHHSTQHHERSTRTEEHSAVIRENHRQQATRPQGNELHTSNGPHHVALAHHSEKEKRNDPRPSQEGAAAIYTIGDDDLRKSDTRSTKSPAQQSITMTQQRLRRIQRSSAEREMSVTGNLTPTPSDVAKLDETSVRRLCVQQSREISRLRTELRNLNNELELLL